MVYVQGVRSGSLLNTRVQPDRTEIKTEFKPGEAFVEGANEPHYGAVWKEPTIIWVTVASVRHAYNRFIDDDFYVLPTAIETNEVTFELV